MWQPGGGLVETPKYKSKEFLKEELGDNFEDFLYNTNIELLKLRDEAIKIMDEYCLTYDYTSLECKDLADVFTKIIQTLKGKEEK